MNSGLSLKGGCSKEVVRIAAAQHLDSDAASRGSMATGVAARPHFAKAESHDSNRIRKEIYESAATSLTADRGQQAIGIAVA